MGLRCSGWSGVVSAATPMAAGHWGIGRRAERAHRRVAASSAKPPDRPPDTEDGVVSRWRVTRATAGFIARIDGVRERTGHMATVIWRELGELLLLSAGLIQLILAASLFKTAWEHQSPVSLSVLLVGSGLALAIAGTLTVFRRRRQLVHRLLGTTTTATYGLALAFLSRSDGDASADILLTFASLFGAMYLITIVFADQIATESPG